jgi:hypothetical protein
MGIGDTFAATRPWQEAGSQYGDTFAATRPWQEAGSQYGDWGYLCGYSSLAGGG